jgi:hypothetical protein
VTAAKREGGLMLALAEVFANFPVALLEVEGGDPQGRTAI